MKRLAVQALGYVFLLLGILGLVLPVLQGVLFIVVGLLLLSRSTQWAPRMLVWLKTRHPHVENLVGRAETLASQFENRCRAWVGR